jgi:hypothetical protein
LQASGKQSETTNLNKQKEAEARTCPLGRWVRAVTDGSKEFEGTNEIRNGIWMRKLQDLVYYKVSISIIVEDVKPSSSFEVPVDEYSDNNINTQRH